jgi:phage tail-like protein
MMNEKITNNYFVLNKYSELWKDISFFDENGIVKLKSIYDVKHKETIQFSFSSNDKYKTPEISDYSFALDYCNILYILDKKAKKIKRCYLDTKKIEELNLLPLNNPKSILISKKDIYILDEFDLYCISKINYQVRRIIQFNFPIDLFTISSDESLIFFYEKTRNKVYKFNLQSGENNLDFITISSDEDDLFKNEHIETKEIVDMTLSDKLGRLLIILNNKELLIYNFDGLRETQIPLDKYINNNFNFEPSSICLDNDHDFVFIGNKKDIKKNFLIPEDFCFPIKIRGLLIDNLSKNSIQKEKKKCIDVDIIDFASNPNKLLLKNSYICDCSIHRENQSILYLIHFVKKDFMQEKECRKTDLSTSKIYLQVEKFEWSNIYKKAKKEETENENENQENEEITLCSERLDSLEIETKWNKIVIDQKIPPDAFSQVYYFCTDDENIIPKMDDDWIKAPLNQHDFLLLNTKDEFLKGRFLYIKMLLSTNDIYTSPEFKSMKVYFGNNSYLDYLPAIYRENESSSEFLEKFLSIFQTMMDDTYQKIFSFSKYLDSQVTPNEFLRWLASWLSISTDQNWSNEGTRALIERAPDLFKKRGTIDGIKEIILLYLNSKNSGKNPNPTIIGDQIYSNNNYYDDSNKCSSSRYTQLKYYNDVKIIENNNNNNNNNRYRYFFDVLLNPILIDENDERVIRQIVEKEKPAHTIGNVKRLDSWFNLDRNTMLGINTILRDPYGFVLGKTSLSRNSILTSRDKSGQIGQSAIGLNTILT